MRIRLVTVAALLSVVAAAGCGSDDSSGVDAGVDPTTSPSASPTGDQPDALPTGKDDLPLEATSYVSPEGFAPRLSLDLQFSGLVGWSSVHRGADAFDLALPNPQADGPLVVFAFLVPAEASAEEALASVRAQATAAGARVTGATGPFESIGATTGVDVLGGQGQVVASKDGGIALDATPGGRLQVYASDQGGSPLLVVAFAPDAKAWPDVDAAMARLSGALGLAAG